MTPTPTLALVVGILVTMFFSFALLQFRGRNFPLGGIVLGSQFFSLCMAVRAVCDAAVLYLVDARVIVTVLHLIYYCTLWLLVDHLETIVWESIVYIDLLYSASKRHFK